MLAIRRLFPRFGKNFLNRMITLTLDRVMSVLLPPCDVFIGMAGVYPRTSGIARRRYGATVVTERGSRHILSQRDTLQRLVRDGEEPVTDFAVSRDLASYEAADFISVPSVHVWQSFIDQGFPAERLFRNPYGVSLDQFEPTPAPPAEPPTVLFAGMWCLRKGCDLLSDAMERLQPRVRLLHVGPVLDAHLPQADWFVHYDAVPQSRLIDYYALAHIFVLPSREEGLALVLPQALRAGLRVVCSDRSGGEDLRDLLALGDAVRVVPHDDRDALVAALQQQLEDAFATQPEGVPRELVGCGVDKLSWQSYGARYIDFLASLPARTDSLAADQ
ncbi:Glycosyltransferase [Marinovum algicola DG 898]|nr:Glycosyltransferase [Marinovum algicola DG 898]